MTNEVTYIMDQANGQFTLMNRTKIPLVTYIGPFKDKQQAINYLASMTNFKAGDEVPEGYALITMRKPLKNWADMPDPQPWQFNMTRQQLFDLTSRYKQAPKRRKKK